MVEIKIVNVDDPSPKATGDYVQVITRWDTKNDPGVIVSDIEHFSVDGETETSRSRQTKEIGFREAIEVARIHAEEQSVAVIYATDRTAAAVA